MTDITNQDRRTAIDVAEAIERGDYPMANMWPILARVILATVDAPAPTLAEELRHITEHWKEWTTKTVTAKLNVATDRAKHMEHDLAEARDEVERLRHNIDEAYKTRDARDDDVYSLRAEVNRLTAERDEARDEANALGEELADAESEVERLTSVNENLRRTDNYREFKEFIGVQKGAESNAESIDPADVKPGEAWLVEAEGEQRTAVKDRSDIQQWNTVNADGWLLTEDDEDITLVSRLVPAPRVITNLDELERLAATSIIRDGRGWPGGITDQGGIMINGFCLSDEDVLSLGPVTVLWEPGA